MSVICEVTCIVRCAQLIGGTLVVVNLLGVWEVTQVLQHCFAMMEDQPPVLLFTHSQTSTHTCSHASLLPAIKVQIWLTLAHIPELTPLLCQSLLHRCMTTRDSATERTAPVHQCGQTSPWAFHVFHPGRFGGPKSEEILLTRNQCMLLPVALAEWRPLASNGYNQRSLRRNFFYWILLSGQRLIFFILIILTFLTFRTYG